MKPFANSISLTIQLFCITPVILKSFPQYVDKFVKELDSSFYFLKWIQFQYLSFINIENYPFRSFSASINAIFFSPVIKSISRLFSSTFFIFPFPNLIWFTTSPTLYLEFSLFFSSEVLTDFSEKGLKFSIFLFVSWLKRIVVPVFLLNLSFFSDK